MLWTIQGVQTSISNEGVIIDTNFNTSVLTITKAARDEYSGNAVNERDRISVRCSALFNSGRLPQVDDGDIFSIVTYSKSV